jgi:hypothetical protein
MKNATTNHCTTLVEFYDEIRTQQVASEGPGYCAHHDAIQRLLSPGDTYKELGVHQGASAASAMMKKPGKVILVDKDLYLFHASVGLFEKYCEENDVQLEMIESDSTHPRTVSSSDVLLIDSFHYPQHLMKELHLHANSVSNYIVIHDTSILHGRQNPALYDAAKEFCDQINPWSILSRNTKNVGYTVLARLL